uniref:Putative secreted protein n=1 Tax=Anopheles marajoara TaxID=58244 RepID=A0A2M4C9I2_9DIPT
MPCVKTKLIMLFLCCAYAICVRERFASGFFFHFAWRAFPPAADVRLDWCINNRYNTSTTGYARNEDIIIARDHDIVQAGTAGYFQEIQSDQYR